MWRSVPALLLAALLLAGRMGTGSGQFNGPAISGVYYGPIDGFEVRRHHYCPG
jgi:hypothetical protein